MSRNITDKMDKGHTHVANGLQMLALDICSKYKKMPRRSKSELITEWKRDFGWKSNDRVYDIIAQREVPSVRERTWLTKQVNTYYDEPATHANG